MTEKSIPFLRKKTLENAVFVRPSVLLLGGGVLDYYLNSNMFDFGFHLILIYFSFLFYWPGHVVVQIKAHARVAAFLSFHGYLLI